MRGFHNIWRLVRTGATLERAGAMNVVLDAFEATPPLRFVARALGLPVVLLARPVTAGPRVDTVEEVRAWLAAL